MKRTAPTLGFEMSYSECKAYIAREILQAEVIIQGFKNRFEIEPEIALVLSAQNLFLSVAIQKIFTKALSDLNQKEGEETIEQVKNYCIQNIAFPNAGGSITGELMQHANLNVYASLLNLLMRIK